MTDKRIAVAEQIIADMNKSLPDGYSVHATSQYKYFTLCKVLKKATKEMPPFVTTVGHRLSFHELVVLWLSPVEHLATRLSSINEAEIFIIKHRLSKGGMTAVNNMTNGRFTLTT